MSGWALYCKILRLPNCNIFATTVMVTFGLTIGVAYDADDVEAGVAESEGPAIGVTNGPIGVAEEPLIGVPVGLAIGVTNGPMGVAEESVIGGPVGLAIGGVAEGLPFRLWMRIRVATSS